MCYGNGCKNERKDGECLFGNGHRHPDECVVVYDEIKDKIQDSVDKLAEDIESKHPVGREWVIDMIKIEVEL